MVNPHHRPKHAQSRSFFIINVDGEKRTVRPVDGRAYYNEPGFESGVVHLLDENGDRAGIVEMGFFDRHAQRVGDDM